MLLGDKIRKYRDEKNLTREDITRATHIAISTLYKIEKNQMNPTFKIVSKIAKAIGVPIGKLD